MVVLPLCWLLQEFLLWPLQGLGMLQGCSEQPSSAPVALAGSLQRAVPICCCPQMLAALPWHSTDTELRARGRISLPEMGFQLLFLAGVAGMPSRAFSRFADWCAWLLTAGSIFPPGALGPDKAGGLNEKQRGTIWLWDTRKALSQICKEPSRSGLSQLSGRNTDFGVLWLAPGEKYPSKPSCCPSHSRGHKPGWLCLTSSSSKLLLPYLLSNHRGGTAAGKHKRGARPLPSGALPQPHA